MQFHCSRSILLLSAVLGLAGMAAAADAPTGNVGLKSSKPTVIDLGPEFNAMAGWQLRLRVLTIEPGGHVGMHSHKDRPSVVYFLAGPDTVIRDDGSSQTFQPGDTTGEPGTTVHWHKNDGKDYVILITADIVKVEPSK
ncbi:cupin domain-containing protein [Bradyrhizobium septentrionale]|uniref:Cupin domain-containing protein n=1 Tax=Bradyrhizobium septentrionale TaxID=1404411 RepID=A0ABZ2P6K3_9BRAD